MSETGTIALIVSIISALVTIAGFFFKRKQTAAETDKTSTESELNKAEAVKIYQEVAKEVREEQADHEKEWVAKLKEQDKEITELKHGRDAANNRIAQLEHEIQLNNDRNTKLQNRIDELEKEAINYRTAISTLLHENGALKEWCERLVRQVMSICPGIEVEPFVKKPRTNE